MTAPERKPYRGVDSYGVEDAALFFGRDRQADRLVALILSSTMTALHARSGAGKTSLLNARIVPTLEARGWTPIYSRPQRDPIEALRFATLRYLFPSPAAERIALQTAIDALGLPAGTTSLGQLASTYEKVPIGDPRKRSLVAPVDDPPANIPHLGLSSFGSVMPYFSRFLRRSLAADTVSNHLHIVADVAGLTLAIDEDSPVDVLMTTLADERMAEGHALILSGLYLPDPGLLPFFENLFETVTRYVPDLALVFLLDQFEELFTLFVAPPLAPIDRLDARPSWTLRLQFFRELELLYRAAQPTHSAATAGEEPSTRRALPLRFVVSLREEYFARLDPIRLFAPELDTCAFHLGLLEGDDAELAIRAPACAFGYDYEPDLVRSILSPPLLKESRFVEPMQLQIICDDLWHRAGSAAAQPGRLRDTDVCSLTLQHLTALDLPRLSIADVGHDGLEGILASFLPTVLSELPTGERLEALDLLEPLITEARTRNIVERRRLIFAPFRKSDARKRVLKHLLKHKIVREEQRLEGRFIEVTHEFLIEPILNAIGLELAENFEFWSLRDALQHLGQASAGANGGHARPLAIEHFLVLDRNRDSLQWTAPATEIMFRSAIARGSSAASSRFWAEQYAAIADGHPDGSIRDRKTFARAPITIGLLRDHLSSLAPLELTNAQLEMALRTTLQFGSSRDKSLLIALIRRYTADAA